MNYISNPLSKGTQIDIGAATGSVDIESAGYDQVNLNPTYDATAPGLSLRDTITADVTVNNVTLQIVPEESGSEILQDNLPGVILDGHQLRGVATGTIYFSNLHDVDFTEYDGFVDVTPGLRLQLPTDGGVSTVVQGTPSGATTELTTIGSTTGPVQVLGTSGTLWLGRSQSQLTSAGIFKQVIRQDLFDPTSVMIGDGSLQNISGSLALNYSAAVPTSIDDDAAEVVPNVMLTSANQQWTVNVGFRQVDYYSYQLSGISSDPIFFGPAFTTFATPLSICGSPQTVFTVDQAPGDLQLFAGLDSTVNVDSDGGTQSNPFTGLIVLGAGTVNVGSITLQQGVQFQVAADPTRPTDVTQLVVPVYSNAPAKLQVDRGANGFESLTWPSIVGPSGPTVGFESNSTFLKIIDQSTTTITFNDTGVAGTDIEMGTGVVQVNGTSGPLFAAQTTSGGAFVLGNAGKLQNIFGNVTITDPSGTALPVQLDNSADPTTRTVLLSVDSNGDSIVSGLAPAALAIDANIPPATILAGTGGTRFEVVGMVTPQFLITGSSTTDTLVGPDTNTTWQLTGADSGMLNGSLKYATVPNLVGGALNDDFIFSASGTVSGKLDGGLGSNTLDYTNADLTSADTINLPNEFAARIAGTTSNIQNVLPLSLIVKGTPEITVSDDGGTYNGTPYEATATASGTNNTPLVDGSFTYVFVDSSFRSSAMAPTVAGSYTVTATYSGDASYNSATGYATFTIGKATPTVTVVANGGIYNGTTTFPASSATATGIASDGNLSDGLFTYAYYSANTLLSGAPSATGTYTVVATYSGDASYNAAAGSAKFVVSLPPSKLVFVPSVAKTLTAGGSTGAVTVQVEDKFGNVVVGDASMLTLKVNGVAITPSITDSGTGIVTFPSQTLTKSGNNTISVTGTPILTAASATIVVSPNVPTHLSYTVQPNATVVAGNRLAAVKVAVEDAYNNIITTDTNQINLTVNPLTGGPSAGVNPLTNGPTVLNTNGVTTFSNMVFDSTGTYSLNVTDAVDFAGTNAVTSNTLKVIPAATTTMIVEQGLTGTTATAGVALSPSLQVAFYDQYGNLATTDTSIVTLTLTGGTFSTGLMTATVRPSSGIATFKNVIFNQAGSYSLTVSDSEATLTSGSTSLGSFTVNPAAASKLVFTPALPTTLTAGDSTGAITVQIEDKFGNLVVGDESTLTLKVNGVAITPSITDSGTAIVTFPSQTLTKSGKNTISVTSTPVLTAASATIAVSPDVPTHLAYTAQPSVTIVAGNATIVKVAVEDTYGNVCTTDANSISLSVNLTGAAGNVSNMKITPDSTTNGVTTFSIVSTTTGGYRLTATGSGPDSGFSQTSNAFTVTSGAAYSISVINGLPGSVVAGAPVSPPVIIGVYDQYGNLDSDSVTIVTLTVTDGTFAAGTTMVSANTSGGIATFKSLTFTKMANNYTLTASDAFLTVNSGGTAQYPVVVGTISVTPAAAYQLVFSPVPTVAGDTSSLMLVQVQDKYGNVVVTATNLVTLKLNGVTIDSTPAIEGIATFSALTLKQGNNTVTVSSTGFVAKTVTLIGA